MQSFATVNIDAPISRVYSVAESYPHFVKAFNVKETIHSDEASLEVKVGTVKFGKQFTWEGRGHKTKNQSIEFVQTNGLFKGLRAKWFFNRIDSNLTSVEIKTEFEIPFLLFGGIFEELSKKYLIENTTNQILNHLKEESERGMPR